jgi:hypothetical protein
MSIHLHIDRLVVHGIDLGANGALQLEQAVHARLAELLALPAAASSADPGTVTIAPRIDGATLGSRVADSLHAGLKMP